MSVPAALTYKIKTLRIKVDTAGERWLKGALKGSMIIVNIAISVTMIAASGKKAKLAVIA